MGPYTTDQFIDRARWVEGCYNFKHIDPRICDFLATCEERDIQAVATVFGSDHVLIKKAQVLRGEHMYGAAQNGYIDCINYLIMCGLKIDPETTYIASRDGNLPMLKYAVNKGMQCTRMDMLISTLAGRGNCTAYLREIGCPEM